MTNSLLENCEEIVDVLRRSSGADVLFDAP